jgi:hypothetical protein
MGIARDMQNAVRMQVCAADKGIQELGATLTAGCASQVCRMCSKPCASAGVHPYAHVRILIRRAQHCMLVHLHNTLALPHRDHIYSRVCVCV